MHLLTYLLIILLTHRHTVASLPMLHMRHSAQVSQLIFFVFFTFR